LQRELRREIAEIKSSVKELVDAWNSAGTMVRMVKYAAGFITALMVLIALFRGYKP
jgi:hypothetical protein